MENLDVVPIDEALAVVRDKVAEYPLHLHPGWQSNGMLTFCVEITYFVMGSDIYQQEGLALG